MIGLVMAATGGSRIEQWMREVPEALLNDRTRKHLNRPGIVITNYNRHIAPVAGYAIRGALWYQGEANEREGREYFLKMQSMITDWRASWGQDDFPFYCVQIASIGQPSADNPAMRDGRARVRNAQLEALTLPNTGIVVTIDISAEREHPRDKYDAGLRLSRWALHHQHGQEDLVPGACNPPSKVTHSEVEALT